MSRRTLLHYIMDVHRETGGQVPIGEVQQAVQDAVQEIDQKANWSFLGAEANLSLVAPYITGTIAGVGGTTAIVGTGTVWNPAWTFRSLRYGGRSLAYPIASFGGAGALVLRDALSGSDVFTAQSYSIYADRYVLPADCEPGRDVVLKGAAYYGRNGEICKMGRALHERRKWEFSMSGYPRWYTDGDLDETTNRPTIVLYPAPPSDDVLRLYYYRSFTVPATEAAYIPIPLAFERLIILKASAILMGRKRMQQWLEKENKAAEMMTDLYNRHAASAAYDHQIEPDDGSDGSLTVGKFIQDSTFFNLR